MRTLAIAVVQQSPCCDAEATWCLRRSDPAIRLVPTGAARASPRATCRRWTHAGRRAVVHEGGGRRGAGAIDRHLWRIARETGLWLVPEVSTARPRRRLHNTALVIANRRARRQLPEAPFLAAIRHFDTRCAWSPSHGLDHGATARVGLAICYDGAFPRCLGSSPGTARKSSCNPPLRRATANGRSFLPVRTPRSTRCTLSARTDPTRTRPVSR